MSQYSVDKIFVSGGLGLSFFEHYTQSGNSLIFDSDVRPGFTGGLAFAIKTPIPQLELVPGISFHYVETQDRSFNVDGKPESSIKLTIWDLTGGVDVRIKSFFGFPFLYAGGGIGLHKVRFKTEFKPQVAAPPFNVPTYIADISEIKPGVHLICGYMASKVLNFEIRADIVNDLNQIKITGVYQLWKR